jgi:urocanate hydratase
MPPEPLSPAAFAFIAQVDEAYTTLMHAAQPESHLGGKLFYAGALTEPACAATVAANIAGAATLAASHDHPAAKQAMRAGQVDFLVNSLDEALRILKNEIRKRETVAVCVTAAPESLEQEMHDRGVQPDLFFSEFVTKMPHEADAGTWLTWRPAQSPALWLPKLDAIALDCLPPDATATRRWLQRAPRYLGRIAQNLRILHTTEPIANQLVAQFKAAISTGEITIQIEIEQGPWGNSIQQSLVPGP